MPGTRRPKSVREGRRLDRVEVTQRDQETRALNEHERCHPAVPTEPATGGANFRLALAVVLQTGQAPTAPSTTPRPIDGHRFADADALYPGAERLDPTCVLVAKGERWTPRQEPRLELVHEVEIRVARAGTTDSHHDLTRPRVWLRYLAEFGLVLPGCQL